tara:strand:+ start:417 stop:980 length:564 start_codon:yes stop_codon:yes gene_type:complete
MSSVIDRLFDNFSRIGNDSCDMTNRNKENIRSASYMLENHILPNSVNSAMSLAMTQPNVIIQGSPQGGINSDNIDANSVLQFGQGTNMRERGLYQQRLFGSIPYLGKGPTNPAMENVLRNGLCNSNRKSLDPNSEVSHLNLAYIPLLPSLEANINNPANCVEGAAHEGWIRGGLPSRLYNREESVNN